MAEVRETSRKPDEMYPLLERLSPGTRKLEIFARPHNVRPGWVSMGNQLGELARSWWGRVERRRKKGYLHVLGHGEQLHVVPATECRLFVVVARARQLAIA